MNGFPKGFIKSTRGIRQEGLLFPLLFFVVTEYLRGMISKILDNDAIYGFRVSNRSNEIVISHLQFADDALGAAKENVVALKNLLIWFDVVSGMKINLHISKLYKVGKVTSFEELASILGCEIDTFPTMY